MNAGYTVILVPGSDGRVSATVPAMPGCVATGLARDEALERIRDAMAAWIDVEAAGGRGPDPETPATVASAVSDALEIIDEMRQAAEIGPDVGYELELVTVNPRQRIAA